MTTLEPVAMPSANAWRMYQAVCDMHRAREFVCISMAGRRAGIAWTDAVPAWTELERLGWIGTRTVPTMRVMVWPEAVNSAGKIPRCEGTPALPR